MKILLATPLRNKSDYYVVPPLGLGYLASALRKNGQEVFLLDCAKDRINPQKYRLYLREKNPDVVGFQVLPGDVSDVNKSLKIVKEELRHAITIIGGPFVTSMSKEVFFLFDNLDYALCGEAEESLPLFLDTLNGLAQLKRLFYNFNDIPGLIYRKNSKIVVNTPQFVSDLNRIPFPAWDLIKPQEYPFAPHSVFFKRWPLAPILISRGCPYNCTFCAASKISGKKIRKRQIGNIMDEIELLYNKFNIRELQIIDDGFMIDSQFVEEFCHNILTKNLDIAWCTSNGVRLDLLNEKLLRLMKKAGLYAVRVGIESGSQRILNEMKKGISLKLIEEKIDLLNRLDIYTHGYFILGYPEETEQEIEETIRFALKLKIQTAGFSLFLPLPGTEIYEYLKTKNRLEKLDYDKMMTHNVVLFSNSITSKKLKRLQIKAFLKFYLRPIVMFNFLQNIKNTEHFKYVLIRFLKIIFSRTQ